MREMREWRKIYSSMVDSEQVTTLSDGAFSLFTLLIIAQDDTGYHPWTPVKIRALTISRNWTLEQAQSFAAELVNAGLVIEQDAGLVLINGQALNGQPRNDRRTLTYQRSTTDIPLVNQRSTTDIPPVNQYGRKKEPKKEEDETTKRRGEERRVRAPAREDIPPVCQRLTTGMSQTKTVGAGGAGMNIFELYENVVGPMNSIISEELKDAEKTYAADWIADAFKEAVDQNARRWAYIRAILERWTREGRGSSSAALKGKAQGTQRGPRVVHADESPAAWIGEGPAAVQAYSIEHRVSMKKAKIALGLLPAEKAEVQV